MLVVYTSARVGCAHKIYNIYKVEYNGAPWKSFNHNLLCETISTLTHLINFVAQFLCFVSQAVDCYRWRFGVWATKRKTCLRIHTLLTLCLTQISDYITLEIEFSESNTMEKRQPQNGPFHLCTMWNEIRKTKRLSPTQIHQHK